MNKYKEAYKEEIVSDIVDKYVRLDISISNSQGAMPEHVLNQKFSALRYMKNLIKNITAESEEEVEQRIKDGYDRFYNDEEDEE